MDDCVFCVFLMELLFNEKKVQRLFHVFLLLKDFYSFCIKRVETAVSAAHQLVISSSVLSLICAADWLIVDHQCV